MFTEELADLHVHIKLFNKESITPLKKVTKISTVCEDNSPDGECLAGWATVNCLALLYNAKDAASYYSGRWNTGTNPDLAFASVGPNSRLPNRRVLDKFPRSQHRPLLITPPRFAMAVPSMPVKR